MFYPPCFPPGFYLPRFLQTSKSQFPHIASTIYYTKKGKYYFAYFLFAAILNLRFSSYIFQAMLLKTKILFLETEICSKTLKYTEINERVKLHS